MIKKATAADLTHIEKIGRKFYESSVWAGVVEYDKAHFVDFAFGMIEQGVIFISEKGMCGGMVAPVYFSSTAKIAAELFWYTEDSHGAALHEAFENWAKEAGAGIVQMTGQINNREKGIRRLYKSRGYEAREIGFFKEL